MTVKLNGYMPMAFLVEYADHQIDERIAADFPHIETKTVQTDTKVDEIATKMFRDCFSNYLFEIEV